ncbi:MAG: AtpZ/AtpI family protein [Bacteroidales bacterium]|nr:AtpZ/AtpI family protein [Bacteroidales bacterium]
MLDKNDDKEKRKALNSYAKISSLVLQMAVMVFLGAWIGKLLDSYLQTHFFTIILVLLMAFLALWYFFKTMLNK